MIAKCLAGSMLVHVGITVNAAVGTGVVGADIGAFRAAAFFPRRFLFIRKSFGNKQALNNTAVYTMAFLNTVVYHVFAAT